MLVNPYYLLFLPAIPGEQHDTSCPASRQQEINGGNQPFTSQSVPAGAPVLKLTPNTKSQKTAIYSGSLGVLRRPAGPGAPSANPHYR